MNLRRPGKGQCGLMAWRLLGLLDEDPHDDDPPLVRRYAKCTGDPVPPNQANVPKTPLEVFHVRFVHALNAVRLDQVADSTKPRQHIDRQRVEFSRDGGVKGFDLPHIWIVAKMRYRSRLLSPCARAIARVGRTC